MQHSESTGKRHWMEIEVVINDHLKHFELVFNILSTFSFIHELGVVNDGPFLRLLTLNTAVD